MRPELLDLRAKIGMMELHAGLCLMLDIFVALLDEMPEADVTKVLERFKGRI